MQILINTFTFGPQVNGVAEVVRHHVEHFVRSGHQVTIATSFDERRGTQRVIPGNPSVVQFSITGAGEPGSPYAGEVSEFQNFVEHWKGDFIICHCWRSWPLDLAYPVFGGNSAKKVLISHGFTAQRWPLNAIFPLGLKTWLKSQPYLWRAPSVMRRFDHIVLLSQKVDFKIYFDHWLARRMGYRNLSVIPTGVELDEFESATSPNFRAAYKLDQRPIVLCVSNYDPLKNPMLPLKAFLSSEVENATLVIIGKEFNEYAQALRSAYQSYTRRGGRSPVIFLEGLDRAMVRAAYEAADLFLCGSLSESGPLVVLEAMASRTPFISTNVGFVSDLAGGVIAGNETEMAQAIRQLLADGEARQKLGSAGRAACEAKYNWKMIMAQYDGLLDRLAGAPRP